MVNLIGEAPATAELAAVTRAHVHLYGKAPRPGRKIGHVTVTGDGDWPAIAAMADAAG
jgi:5-(carboxyamino)imidazole ribonucleotide synthase